MTSSIARNDPCPCGSGKKYKKCHGLTAPSPAAVRPEAARATALKALDVHLADRLVRFAQTRFGPRGAAEAIHAYLGTEDRAPPDSLQLALPGALYRLPATPDGRTLADLWREEQEDRLSSDARLLLDAYAASWLSIWKVREVEPGVGSLLSDLLTGEQRFVDDASSANTLTPHDTLLAVVLDCDGVSFFGGAHAQPLPPREGDAVAVDARRICRVRTRPVSVAKLRDPAIQRALIARWRREVTRLLTKPPPTLQNTDGDPLLLTTDDFELIASREEVVGRLRSLPGAEEPEHDASDVVFTVTKPGNPQHRGWANTVVARIVVVKQRLRIETNSTRRADSLRAAVERHLEHQVLFRLRQETNTSALMESARTSAGAAKAPARDTPPPDVLVAVRQVRERYMTAWLDDTIPALDGLTPRHAVTLPRMRRRVELLLEEMEQSERRLPATERIDVRRLRVALGLTAADEE